LRLMGVKRADRITDWIRSRACADSGRMYDRAARVVLCALVKIIRSLP
jgi:hypothetical protein